MKRFGCKVLLLLGGMFVLGELHRLNICVLLILWKAQVHVCN